MVNSNLTLTRRLALRLFVICSICMPVFSHATSGALPFLTESGEIAKGREMHEEMMSKGARYDDEELQAYIQKVGESLAAVSERPHLDWTFTVIDDENINAYALPGGFIYINRGLLAYMETEAQLAAVLGHEIGHVTAHHASRQRNAQAGNKLLQIVALLATRNYDVANTTNLLGTSLVRGYGRDHELEADRLGAVYLHTMGYDTEALIDVIGILKNQETYSKLKAKEAGRKTGSYHGVFSTHPRNDARLKTVVRAAKELGASPPSDVDPSEFRQQLEGLPWGRSVKPPQRQEDRFYHNKLNFTFAHPKEWKVDTGSKAISASEPDGKAKVEITILRREKDVAPRDFLSKHMDAKRLLRSEPLNQFRLQGHTGVTHPKDGAEKRLAVLYYGSLAYLFEASAADMASREEYDPAMFELIQSFRPMKAGERGSTKTGPAINFVQAKEGDTFAKLAKQNRRIGRDGENKLRLINGYYPTGEPTPGEWIKLVK